MIKATVRYSVEDNKFYIDVESSTYQIDSLISRNMSQLDKIINEGKQAYAIFESIAGSQITFRCLLNAGEVDVECLVSLVEKKKEKVSFGSFHILIDPSKAGKDFIKVSEVV